MANTILVKRELSTEDMRKKFDAISRLTTEFIEKDVASVLSNINEKYEVIELPQKVQLIIGSVILSEDEAEEIEYIYVDEAIESTCLSTHHDYLCVEMEGESIDGYLPEGRYQWERKCYYHFAYANFTVEYDADKRELTIIADCNGHFCVRHNGTDEDYEITREEYISERKRLITDKETVMTAATGNPSNFFSIAIPVAQGR